jgi:outer membrane lipoprotein SlyB
MVVLPERSDDMRLRFIVALAAALAAAPVFAAAPLLDGVVEQTIDLLIPDADHQGVAAIVGLGMPLGTGDLVGQGNAADVAAVAAALAKAGEGAELKSPVGLRVIVRLSNGVLVVVLQPVKPRAFVGQSVRIEGSGAAARVVARKAE